MRKSIIFLLAVGIGINYFPINIQGMEIEIQKSYENEELVSTVINEAEETKEKPTNEKVEVLEEQETILNGIEEDVSLPKVGELLEESQINEEVNNFVEEEGVNLKTDGETSNYGKEFVCENKCEIEKKLNNKSLVSETIFAQVQGEQSYKYAYETLELVNKERRNSGMSELTMDSSLITGAMLRAVELRVDFSHNRPNEQSFYTIFEDYQIILTTIPQGENIAIGIYGSNGTPEAVMQGWMESPGHKNNILNSNYKSMGIGHYTTGGLTTWVQIFGGTDSSKIAEKSIDNKKIDYKIATTTLDTEILFNYHQPYVVDNNSKVNINVSGVNRGWERIVYIINSDSINFSSSNEKVATIDNGIINAKKIGKTSITATTKRKTKSARLEIEIQKESLYEKYSQSEELFFYVNSQNIIKYAVKMNVKNNPIKIIEYNLGTEFDSYGASHKQKIEKIFYLNDNQTIKQMNRYDKTTKKLIQVLNFYKGTLYGNHGNRIKTLFILNADKTVKQVNRYKDKSNNITEILTYYRGAKYGEHQNRINTTIYMNANKTVKQANKYEDKTGKLTRVLIFHSNAKYGKHSEHIKYIYYLNPNKTIKYVSEFKNNSKKIYKTHYFKENTLYNSNGAHWNYIKK